LFLAVSMRNGKKRSETPECGETGKLKKAGKGGEKSYRLKEEGWAWLTLNLGENWGVENKVDGDRRGERLEPMGRRSNEKKNRKF